MGLLVNIDNGGTLTDICVSQGSKVWRTKTLTTPFDLSRCLMDGLKKASGVVFGEEDLERLLLATDHIRYSTTQGTNAIVQRKGPRLGLVFGGSILIDALRAQEPDLFNALVSDRVAAVPIQGEAGRYDVVRAVSDLAAKGANRIVLAFGSEQRDTDENAIKTVLLRAFPPHLLGALPILYSHEIASDDDDIRRTWTALLNAFLHPAMEHFLYSAEQRLRDAKAQNPLLIFRNDGQSARVAKTTAIKTYSSGPRGGADGAEQLARHYGIDHLVSVDIGGTTTDISVVEKGRARANSRGRVAGVETSFPLVDVFSVGVGGSSIIRADGQGVRVGPESVGSAPGPASFGLGGTDATMTDGFFASGLLDPHSFFGGAMKIDVERARAAIAKAVGAPLGLDEDAAIAAMEAAWVSGVAEAIHAVTVITPETVLAAFGGAGPFVICKVAERLGISTVFIPKLAAIFSAFGIGFSDIGHSFEAQLPDQVHKAFVRAGLLEKAQRSMAAEGVDPAACEVVEEVFIQGAANWLRLTINKSLPHPTLVGRKGAARSAAAIASTRMILVDGARRSVPLYRADQLEVGGGARGPAVLEEEFYTCRIDAGWCFTANEAGDIIITRSEA